MHGLMDAPPNPDENTSGFLEKEEIRLEEVSKGRVIARFGEGEVVERTSDQDFHLDTSKTNILDPLGGVQIERDKMAGQSNHELSLFSAEELEFIAEDEIVDIVPNLKMGPLNFICGDFGPFTPQIVTQVPLWLAIALKKRGKCSIRPPQWMSVGELPFFIIPPSLLSSLDSSQQSNNNNDNALTVNIFIG
ncbi:hypothetical protein V8G54_021779 [Vigna mungo]|uniref:DNA replication complex GINS protein PSF2 N-terminal domain-containing protein n=1 Tax=Vigna mungo TaxID=3915 RepID=A0AAQ3RX77_VIGMU